MRCRDIKGHCYKAQYFIAMAFFLPPPVFYVALQPTIEPFPTRLEFERMPLWMHTQ
jgi:hypothetical protein